jgi:hypothetical protein
MTEQAFLRKFNQMPDSTKQELLAFIEYFFFRNKPSQLSLPIEKPNCSPKKPLKAGFLKGTFILSHDFDMPLEDFKDYM